MSIKILFFASLAELASAREITLDPTGFPDIGSVFNKFAKDYPALERYRTSIHFALNSEFARPDSPIRDGDEIAFFPPVSGG
jgi:molybdopterin converting factor subunit 1